MVLGVLVTVSSPWGWTGQTQAAQEGTRGDETFSVWLYSDHPEQLIQSTATSEDVGSLVYAVSRFPVFSTWFSCWRRRAKVTVLEGSEDIAGRPGLFWAVESCPGNIFWLKSLVTI